MDIAFLFEAIGRFFIQLCNVSFSFAGIDVTVGSFFIYSGIAGIAIWFLRELSN